MASSRAVVLDMIGVGAAVMVVVGSVGRGRECVERCSECADCLELVRMAVGYDNDGRGNLAALCVGLCKVLGLVAETDDVPGAKSLDDQIYRKLHLGPAMLLQALAEG